MSTIYALGARLTNPESRCFQRESIHCTIRRLADVIVQLVNLGIVARKENVETVTYVKMRER
jgi:hypothetical protein